MAELVGTMAEGGSAQQRLQMLRSSRADTHSRTQQETRNSHMNYRSSRDLGVLGPQADRANLLMGHQVREYINNHFIEDPDPMRNHLEFLHGIM
jgi:hypothetical protein